MTPLAAYLLLFVAVGVGFIFVHLMAGKLIRPNKPFADKRTIYECGEPTIGSAWIQFDVRFYVVALLFVIFDVEVAFFFPWAVVFGKANAVTAVGRPTTAEHYHEIADRSWELVPPADRSQHNLEHKQVVEITQAEVDRLHELEAKANELKARDREARLPVAESTELDALRKRERVVVDSQKQARTLSWMALVEIAVFFGVLLVGYAYLWRRGDLAWVRSLAAERAAGEPLPAPPPATRQPASTPLAETAAHS